MKQGWDVSTYMHETIKARASVQINIETCSSGEAVLDDKGLRRTPRRVLNDCFTDVVVSVQDRVVRDKIIQILTRRVTLLGDKWMFSWICV